MAKEIIKTDEVKQIATLSRLNFSDFELEGLKKDLGEIVDYFGVLNGVDTSKVNVSNCVCDELRGDIPKIGLTAAQVVKNAPHKNTNSFIVPRVVE